MRKVGPGHAAITIFVAEDDPDDQLLLKEAVAEAGLCVKLRFFVDGVALLQGLRHATSSVEAEDARPSLILLDLNMPRMDGRQALREIMADPNLARIPVVVLTTSRNPDDIARSKDLSASAFRTKPSDFKDLVCLVGTLPNLWLQSADSACDRPASAPT